MSSEFVIGAVSGRVNVVNPNWQWLNPNLDRAQVARTSEEWNKPGHVREFIDRTSVYSLEHSGHRLHFTVSDTPYSNNHFMLVLENDGMIERPDWRQGLIIHDQSQDARSLYWLTVLKSLAHLGNDKKSNGVTVFTENTCSQVTNSTARLPRSIGLIHGHIIHFAIDDLEQNSYVPESDVEGFSQEIELWESRHQPFLTVLNNGIAESGYRRDLFKKRETKLPPGYSLETHIKDTRLETAGNVGELLTAHHLAYKSAAGILSEGEASAKPQPSYRSYIELSGSGLMRISFSPIILSHPGSISAAGIFTNRIQDPDYPIGQRRRADAQTITQVANSVVRELDAADAGCRVLREQYPY